MKQSDSANRYISNMSDYRNRGDDLVLFSQVANDVLDAVNQHQLKAVTPTTDKTSSSQSSRPLRLSVIDAQQILTQFQQQYQAGDNGVHPLRVIVTYQDNRRTVDGAVVIADLPTFRGYYRKHYGIFTSQHMRQNPSYYMQFENSLLRLTDLPTDLLNDPAPLYEIGHYMRQQSLSTAALEHMSNE